MAYIFKNSTYTAVSGDQIICDTTSGSFSILLPDSPSSGDWVEILDQEGMFGDNPLTVDANGKDIVGGDTSFLANNKNDVITFVWVVNDNVFSGVWLVFALSTLFNTR